MRYGWQLKTPWLTRWTTIDVNRGPQSRISPTARKIHTKGEKTHWACWAVNLNWGWFYSSVSLTSLDSEEQESLRANERLHNRTNRNSTGGISTHSLNEAELAVRTIALLISSSSNFAVDFLARLWEVKRKAESGTHDLSHPIAEIYLDTIYCSRSKCQRRKQRTVSDSNSLISVTFLPRITFITKSLFCVYNHPHTPSHILNYTHSRVIKFPKIFPVLVTQSSWVATFHDDKRLVLLFVL